MFYNARSYFFIQFFTNNNNFETLFNRITFNFFFVCNFTIIFHISSFAEMDFLFLIQIIQILRERLSTIFKNVMFSIKLFKSDSYALMNIRFKTSSFLDVITRFIFFFIFFIKYIKHVFLCLSRNTRK